MRIIIRNSLSMDYRTQLITLAKAYAKHRRLSTARISTLCANTGKFFTRLELGGTCSVDTYLAVKAWFHEQWPPDLPWPDGVDRPDVLPRDAA